MRRFIIPALVVAIAAVAFHYRDRWLPQPAGQANHLGYIEGETTLIGAPQAGRLVRVDAIEGGTVLSGAVLFVLDPAKATAEVARTDAALATARAVHDNLLTGKRQDEVAVIDAQIAQAEASLELARKDMTRAATLASTGTAARSRLDQAAEQVTLFEARLRELKSSQKVAGLPARTPEIEAAASRIVEAQAQLDMARQSLSDLSPRAPADAHVEDVFFKAGEWVTAGQAVVSLLQPADVTVRFFLPESALARAVPGHKIRFQCDGCTGTKTATITRVATEPEFTPPVIYSEGTRAKLVYLVEARPDAEDLQLRPGLPVSVEPLQ